MDKRNNKPGELLPVPVASGALQAFSRQSLDIVLATEMHVTRLNAKAEPDELLDSEFMRCFACEDPEAVQWAFSEWREKSPFWPAISDIRHLVGLWHAERRRVREFNRTRDEREDRRKAREAGMSDELKAMISETSARVAMNGLRVRSEELEPRAVVTHTREEWEARRNRALAQVETALERARQKSSDSAQGA